MDSGIAISIKQDRPWSQAPKAAALRAVNPNTVHLVFVAIGQSNVGQAILPADSLSSESSRPSGRPIRRHGGISEQCCG